MKNYTNIKLFSVVALIIIASISRLIPHPPNFTPILSMALFGGAMIDNKKIAYLFPLLAMLLSDAIIGFHSGMWAVYLTLAAIAFLGSVMIKKSTVKNIVLTSIFSSVLFFVTTNFSSWLLWDMYPKNISGLLLAYEAAIPFYANTLISTLLFSSVLFGAFKLLENKILVKAKVN